MLGKAFLQFGGAFRPPQARTSESTYKASNHGASLNGASRDTETVEMHIASSDPFDDYPGTHKIGINRRNSVHVTPPRNGVPQQLGERHGGHLTNVNGSDRAEIKAVKAELSMTNAELRAKSTELMASEKNLRAREAEVALLRAALTGRDISLRDAKSEIAEAQSAVNDKDAELQNAFQQLMANAKERGSLRHRLLTIQDELSQTRKELEKWTTKGFELNQEPVEDGASSDTQKKREREVSSNGKMGKLHEQDQISKLLESLSRLSQTIAEDALADEQAVHQFSE